MRIGGAGLHRHGAVYARTGFESVDMNRRPNKCTPANRRYASPLNAGLQLGRVLHAQPCSPAAVAELGRYALKENTIRRRKCL